MANLGFFKEQYDRELNRKAEISSSMQTWIPALSLEVGAIFFSLKGFVSLKGWLWEGLFWLFWVLSLVFCTLATINLYKILTRFTYWHLPSSHKFSDHLKDLKEYSISIHSDDPDMHAEKVFDDQLLDIYVDYASENIKINDTKIFLRTQAIKMMFVALLFISMSQNVKILYNGVSMRSLTKVQRGGSAPHADRNPTPPTSENNATGRTARPVSESATPATPAPASQDDHRRVTPARHGEEITPSRSQSEK